jgi:hypothetical protein
MPGRTAVSCAPGGHQHRVRSRAESCEQSA